MATTLRPRTAVTFAGRCEEAFRFYEAAFGASIQFLMRWRDAPDTAIPPGWEDKVFHATLAIGDTTINGSDHGVEVETGLTPRFSFILNLSDPAEADRIYAALAASGHVTAPMQETFWAPRFGCVTDQFGISWTINCERASEVTGAA